MRRHHLLRAAGRVASLDIFVMNELDHPALDEMVSIYGARVGCVRSAVVPHSRARRLVQHLRHLGSPARVARRDWHALREDLLSWMASYEVTIVELIDDFLVLARILQSPLVVDHDDRDSDVVR